MLYVHHVPGRLRVRSRCLKGDRVAGLAVCAALRLIEGVTEAVTNPATGSVTVRYEHRRMAVGTIWQVLHREGVVASPYPTIVEGKQPGTVGTGGDGPTALEKLADTLLGVVVEKIVERSTLALFAALV
jgi:Heavy metal associated domain 2